MKKQVKKRSFPQKIILYIVFGFLLSLSAAAFSISVWYKNTFPLDFKTLLYVLASPLQGTGGETIKEVILATVPAALAAALVYTAVLVCVNRFLSPKKPKVGTWVKRIGAVLCCVCLVFSAVFGVFALRIPRYLAVSGGTTGFYEEYYIDPEEVEITSDGKTKNLLYIYVESMESTYASVEDGGRQAENYMPYLTALAEEHISFTEKADGSLGGFICPQGTGWTVAALVGTSAGIPFSFPLGENGNNAMSQEKYFASGLTTLGDILEEKGYRQVFLCGSDIAFGGRDKYYEQHGNYEIYDLATAREKGVVPENYHNGFWGIEDYILFDIAKTELTQLAKEDEPFNFTMLTVDLHHNGGFTCKLCGKDYGGLSEKHQQTANVITCNDKLLAEFIDWCKAQDWYEDTVIVLTGDHPRMDVRLVAGVPYTERTVYNCFINPAAEIKSGIYAGETGRTWTSFDVFPTTLAAMGFDIEGERLALGTNMFSGLPTLAEELGFDELETEIQKHSDYYIMKFCPELAGRDPLT